MSQSKKNQPPVGQKVSCDYCGEQASYIDSAQVYGGKSYGMIYFCDCQDGAAYVGCHPSTNVPMGRLANPELRKAKVEAHISFDQLWRKGDMTRREAYAWLQGAMSLTAFEAHIGKFTIEQCHQVVELVLAKQGVKPRMLKFGKGKKS
jgi:hypothetical protein